MIIGKVTTNLEAVIELEVGNLNQWEKIESVIDTGFSGYLALALPSDLIDRFKLPQIDAQEVILGDGTTVVLEKYLVKVLWYGKERSVSALRADGGPLAGMSLFYGSHMILDVVEDGNVEIDALPLIG